MAGYEHAGCDDNSYTPATPAFGGLVAAFSNLRQVRVNADDTPNSEELAAIEEAQAALDAFDEALAARMEIVFKNRPTGLGSNRLPGLGPHPIDLEETTGDPTPESEP